MNNLKPRAVQNLLKVNRAIKVLVSRGVPHVFHKGGWSIVLSTEQGTVVYYPASQKFQHQLVFHEAEVVEDMLAYVLPLGVVDNGEVKKERLRSESDRSNPYYGVDYQELISLTPVNKLAAINVSKGSPIDVMDDAKSMYKSYNLAIKRLREIIAEIGKEDPHYSELVAHLDAIWAEREIVKSKYPFLEGRRRSLHHFILDSIKAEMSEEKWNAHVRNGEKLMMENYYEGM